MIHDPAFPPPNEPLGSHQAMAAAPVAPVDAFDPPASAGASLAPEAGFVPVRAMEAVLAARVRQIDQFGHTPARDAAQSVDALLIPVARYFKSTRENLACNAPLETTRRHAVQLGAMVLALIDRIDHEQESRHG